MKDRYSIGEFARLENTTAETLRHYDRVGLLKPFKIDEVTGYRYYSILQHEKLSTILELRKIGMSVDEIKKYFDNRNLSQSLNILKEKYEELKLKLIELEELEKNIGEKINHLEFISNIDTLEEIFVKYYDKRYILTFDEEIDNDLTLNYNCLKLERELNETAPIVGSNRYASIIKLKNGEVCNRDKYKLGLFMNDIDDIDDDKIRIIKKGTYVCMYYKGDIREIENKVKRMITYIENNNFQICGDVIQIVQVDISVTDKKEEELFEIQIPVVIK